MKSKAGFIICCISAALLLVESIIDVFLYEYYASLYGETSFSVIMSTVLFYMAIAGIVVAIMLGGFLLYMSRDDTLWHYIVILVVTVVSFVGTAAVFSLVLLFVGSIFGIIECSKSNPPSVAIE